MHEPNISPLARRLAEENNVYWQHLMGTGPEGKVVEKDVIEYLHRVMAGEEAINSTPEPLPTGVAQWPQEDLENLVVPGQEGQEQYGGEMQTSWQNEAIDDLADLEESKAGATVVESQADLTNAGVEQSSGKVYEDELDDSLLLNDDSPHDNSLNDNLSQQFSGNRHQAVSNIAQKQHIDSQIDSKRVDVDTFDDDLTLGGDLDSGRDSDSGLASEGLAARAPKPVISSATDSNASINSKTDNYDSDFTDGNFTSSDFTTSGLTTSDTGLESGLATDAVSNSDKSLDTSANLSEFAVEDDAFDYLGDDFGLDGLDTDLGADLDIDLTDGLDADLTQTDLTQTDFTQTDLTRPI